MSLEATHAVVIFVVALVAIAFWILAIVSITRRPGISGFERGVWVTISILFPLLGPLLWATWGRSRNRAPIRTT
jgi:hypothetical protein